MCQKRIFKILYSLKSSSYLDWGGKWQLRVFEQLYGDLATLAAHKMSWSADLGKSGPESSSIMAASLSTSAKRRHFLHAWSRSVPRSHVKAMPPAIPAPSRSSHVSVADSAVADSSPTPTPFNTACERSKNRHLYGSTTHTKGIFSLLNVQLQG